LNLHSEPASSSLKLEDLNVTRLIEESGLSTIQIKVFCLCAIVALVDGFDSQLLGPAAPSIASSLHLRVGDFGPIFSASQVGFFLGALILGPAADYFGRRRVLVATTSVFAAFTLLTALSHSFFSLLLYRFIVGVALGGASPSFIGLAAEYLPLRRRTQLVTMLWAAVPLGGMLGAAASSALIQYPGWQASFYVGGFISLVLALLLGLSLPESIGFLVKEGESEAKVRSIIKKITGGEVDLERRLVVDDHNAQGVPLRQLFQEGRALSTTYLWALCFMAWMVLIVVSFWTPTLVQNLGFTPSAAAMTLLFNNVGAVVGTVLIGSAMQRYGKFGILTLSFFGAALSIGGFGVFTSSLGYVLTSSTLSGFFLSASCAGLIAIAADSYPTSIRSTGIGWAIGIGRIGSIVGPVFAGQLLTFHHSAREIYLAFGIPCLCASVFVMLLWRHTRRASGSGQEALPLA